MRASGASLHVPDLRCYVGSLVSFVSQFRCFYALLLFDFYVYASSSSSSSVLALCAACSTEAAPTSVPRLDFCGLVSGLHFALVYHLRSCASSRPHLIPPPCLAPLLTCSRLSLCSRRKAARRISRRRRVSMTLPPASVLFRSVASLTASPLVRDSSCLISSFNLPKLSPSSLRNSPLIRFVSLHLCTGCSGSAAFMFVVTAPYACHATTVLWHPC